MAINNPPGNTYDSGDGDFKAPEAPADAPKKEVPSQQPQPAAPAAPNPDTMVVPEPTAEEMEYGRESKAAVAIKIGAVIAVIAVAAVLLYVFVINKPAPSTTSTVPVASFSINSCSAITAAGTYYLSGNVTAPTDSGTCISIAASNVRLMGGGYKLTGKGPFTDSAPSSYGLEIGQQSNITVSDLSVTDFSYGIYLNGSDYVGIANSTVTNSTISSIVLYDARYNILSNDKLTGALGDSGSLSIEYGGNNTVTGTSADYNTHYGISISNSTGNRILNSSSEGNPVDLVCRGNATSNSANKFSGSVCYVNDQCNFAYCREVNNQSSVLATVLQPNINTCGTIASSGYYTLSGNLDMQDYVNTSLPQSKGLSCISVNASDVNLNCDGHAISNAPYGISSQYKFNLTVSDCSFLNDTYGIYLNNLYNFGIKDISVSGGGYGVYILNSTQGNLTSVTSSGASHAGVYVNGTQYVNFDGFNITRNGYGFFLDNSSNLAFDRGTTEFNTKSDMYCSNTTYASSLISTSGVTCGSTDCNWATSCPVKTLPNIGMYPISACGKISVSGQYSITDNILANNTCITIAADNVSVDCNARTITSINGDGSAFSVVNSSNVSISSCLVRGSFRNGVKAVGSSGIELNQVNISGSSVGINLTRSGQAVITNDSVDAFGAYGYLIRDSNSSAILLDHAYGAVDGRGYELSDSFDNLVLNSSSNNTEYGFYFNNSRSNFVYGDAAFQNTAYSYYCSASSSSAFAQLGWINSGGNNANCKSLVVQQPSGSGLQLACEAISNNLGVVTLQQDAVYGYGDTCFNIYSNSTASANGTTIDCGGHTILATDGGTFVQSSRTSDITIKNCVLLGFSTAINITSNSIVSGISIINNTFGYTSGASISVSNATKSRISNNTVMYSPYGIYLYNFNDGIMRDNIVSNTTYGLYLNRTSGLELQDSILSNASSDGLYCSASSGAKTSQNDDLGGNICSSESGCLWITSPLCK